MGWIFLNCFAGFFFSVFLEGKEEKKTFLISVGYHLDLWALQQGSRGVTVGQAMHGQTARAVVLSRGSVGVEGCVAHLLCPC